MKTENGVTYFQQLGFQMKYLHQTDLNNELYKASGMTKEDTEKIFLEACRDMVEIDVGEYIKRFGVYCFTSEKLLSTFFCIIGNVFITVCPDERRYLHDVQYTEDFYKYRATERLTNNEKHFIPSK